MEQNLKLKKNIKLLITADGGAASGKTTGAKLISKKYGLNFLSSGLLYRYISYKLLSRKKIKNKNLFLKNITKNITPKKLKNNKLFTPNVTRHTSIIAKNKNVRNLLKKYQKNFARQRLACIEGRDIGSVVCPKADIKIFFKCSLKVKAKRRLSEFRKMNKKIKLREVEKALKKRDLTDTQRKISPLRLPLSAYIVDTSKLNKKQVLNKLSSIIDKKLKKKYGKNYEAR